MPGSSTHKFGNLRAALDRTVFDDVGKEHRRQSETRFASVTETSITLFGAR
jgi:hypothetical protein